MDELTPTASAPAAPSVGDAAPPTSHGSADPSPASGSTSSAAPAASTPTSETKASRFGWKSMEEAESRYLGLQRELSQHVARVSSLGDLNQAAERLALVDALTRDPKFLTWAQQRTAEEQAGASDPDTMRALSIIDARVQEGIAQAVAPLQAQAVETRLKSTFAQMDQMHGPEWQEFKPQMQAILQEGIRSGHFSPDVETNFDLRFVNGLFAMATAGDPNFAAKAHARRLSAKQSTSTTAQPGTAPSAIGSGRAYSIQEAAAMARKQLGMG